MNILKSLVKEQEKNLYDFLMMKFMQCQVKNQSQFRSQTPQLNSSYWSCTKNITLTSLFIDDNEDLSRPQNIISGQRQNKQEEFKNMVKLFGLEFNSINELNQKLFEVVCNGSLTKIVKDNLMKMNLDVEDETIVFEKDYCISLMVEALIISKNIAFEKTDIQADFQRIYHEVQLSLNYFIQQNHQLFYQSQLNFDLIGTIQRDISVFLKEIYFREENNEEKLKSHFFNSFQQFKAIITVQQRLNYKNILDLHFLPQLLSDCSKHDQFLKMKTQSNLFFDYHSQTSLDLQSINYFTVSKTVDQSSQLRLNKQIVNSFIKQPYQTSLFILYILLKNSQIKNVRKIFEINSSEKFLDPITFLLVDTKLITPLNCEIFSLSLWITLESWINYLQRLRHQNHEEYSNKKLSQIPSKSHGFPISSAQPLKIIQGDPRKIYAVKRQDKQQSILKNQVHQSIQSFSQQFEVQYKRPLMYTIVVYLLTLNVQTTMLKYYPIETDLIKQLIQGDLLPQLLVKNQYLFKAKNFSNNLTDQRKSAKSGLHQVQIEKEFLNKIQNVSSLEELERLKMEYEKQMQTFSSGTIFSQDNDNEFREYPLPWVSLIESKQVLYQLLNKPEGYSLALNFIQRNPNTFTKMYETYIPSMILNEMQHKNHSNRNQYKFRGNRNTKCKKTMGYFPEKVRNKDISQNEQYKNDSAKTDAMKKIMELYRSKLVS